MIALLITHPASMTEFLPTTTFPPMNTFAPTVISLSILALLFITAEELKRFC